MHNREYNGVIIGSGHNALHAGIHEVPRYTSAKWNPQIDLGGIGLRTGGERWR